MFRFILCLLVLLPSVSLAVTPSDVISAVNVVSVKMQVPVQIEVHQNMEDPVGAGWKPISKTCAVYISEKNVNFLGIMLLSRPAVPMLEGLMAHELAHCIDVRAVATQLGVTSTRRLFEQPAMVLQSEILADIVAIMYWKQEYPKQADYLISGLLQWRKSSAASDPLHYTYPALLKALPMIPPRVDYEEAVAIRSKVQ